MVSTALTFLNYVHRRAAGEADDKDWIRAINFLRDLIFATDDVVWPHYSEEKMKAYWLGFKAGRANR